MTDIEKYYDFTEKVLSCFDDRKHGRYILTHGGCLWFAGKVKDYIPCCSIVLNRMMQHCAIMIDGKVYDITGCINPDGFKDVSDKDMQYMEKHFRSRYDLDLICKDISVWQRSRN